MPLLLRTAHLSTRDLLFGGPVGRSVALTYPDGRKATVRLDRDGKATVENLARGCTPMRVDAPATLSTVRSPCRETSTSTCRC